MEGQSKLITKKSSKLDKTNYKKFKKNSQQVIPQRFQMNLIENRKYPYDHTYDVPDAATYPYKFYFTPDKNYCSGGSIFKRIQKFFIISLIILI